MYVAGIQQHHFIAVEVVHRTMGSLHVTGQQQIIVNVYRIVPASAPRLHAHT